MRPKVIPQPRRMQTVSLAAQAQVKFAQGFALHQQGQLEQARQLYQQVLKLQPQHFDALHLSGVIADQTGHAPQAVALMRAAIAINSKHPSIYNNLGNALINVMQHEAAIESYSQAIALKPDYAAAYNNRGNALRELGHAQLALQNYDQAIALSPDYVEAHWNKALCYLQAGHFELGWLQYEWRWKRPEIKPFAREFAQPVWAGQGLKSGQTHRLLLWAEQGVGDQIFCLGMLDAMLQRAPQISVAVDARLVSLVQRSFPAVKALALNQALAQEPCDSHLPMMDMGRYVRRAWDDFPLDRRFYLVADAARAARLRAQVTARKPRVCGLSWLSTNPTFGPPKTIALQALAPVLRLPDFEFIDLQYGDTSAQRQAVAQQLGVQVQRVQEVDNLQDIDGLAALMSACDVIVTISNTTAHLAGALGKTVYLLLPHGNGLHWYWHQGRLDSPWYPSIKLYRQAKAGQWNEVIERVAADLACS